MKPEGLLSAVHTSRIGGVVVNKDAVRECAACMVFQADRRLRRKVREVSSLLDLCAGPPSDPMLCRRQIPWPTSPTDKLQVKHYEYQW